MVPVSVCATRVATIKPIRKTPALLPRLPSSKRLLVIPMHVLMKAAVETLTRLWDGVFEVELAEN